MNFRFHFERALQASAYLLRLDGKRMGYLRLLKLLYIADREWLAETGESITGDRAYAMKYGPVLSSIYDLIQGNGSRAGEWDDYIHTEGYALELVADPGRSELSKGIVQKLLAGGNDDPDGNASSYLRGSGGTGSGREWLVSGR